MKENGNAKKRQVDRQTDRSISLPFLNFSASSITRLVMAASKTGVRGGQWPVRVIGWPPRTCHERVAVRGDGVGTGEKQRHREGDSGNRDAGECLEVEDARRVRRAGRSEEDLEGL